MALCSVFNRWLFRFFIFFFSDCQLFRTEHHLRDLSSQNAIWCIENGYVLVLHFNPWVEASAGGLLVPKGLYSSVAKYFCTGFKIRIWIELSREKYIL
jgi:hypothetical protein